jgi:hypothetical protein
LPAIENFFCRFRKCYIKIKLLPGDKDPKKCSSKINSPYSADSTERNSPLCWLHIRFGNKARRCEQPCAWPEADLWWLYATLAQISPDPAAFFFVNDVPAQHKLLEDTGSSYSILPFRCPAAALLDHCWRSAYPLLDHTWQNQLSLDFSSSRCKLPHLMSGLLAPPPPFSGHRRQPAAPATPG